MSRVYIAGPIGPVEDLAQTFRRYDEIGSSLQKENFTVAIPHRQFLYGVNPNIVQQCEVEAPVSAVEDYGKDVSESEVFLADMSLFHQSDAVCCWLTQDSTGTGLELGLALALRKPVVVFAPKDVRVSKMVTGAAQNSPLFQFEEVEYFNPALIAHRFRTIYARMQNINNG